MMKRFLHAIIGVSLLAAVWLPFGSANAQNLQQACDINQNSALCRENTASAGGNTVFTVLRNIANLVSIVAGVAGVIMIAVGGFRYIRSSGDPSATGEAQKTIIYAVIGLIVSAAGQIIVAFVLNRLPAA